MFRAVALGLLGAVLLTVGCGDDETPAPELVSFHDASTLDFGPSDNGSRQVFHYDERTVIDGDGGGTQTSVLFEGPRTFHVPKPQLDRLEDDLSRLDLGELEARFGFQQGDDANYVLTYGGQTVILGDRIEGAERDEQVQGYKDTTDIIYRLAEKAYPARFQPRRTLAEVRELRDRLRPARRGPTCEQVRRLVEKNPRLGPEVRRKLYARVRPSEKPCP